MFNSDNGYSLADVAAVAGNRSNGGFGWGFGDGSLVLILFVLFIFGGWGGNGFFGGWGNNNANSALTRGELCQDMNFLGLTNNVDAVKQGLNDALFTVNTNLLQGFDNTTAAVANSTAALQNTLATGFANIALNDVRNTDALQLQLSNNALAAQQRGCETNNLIATQFANTNYNLATEECATRTAMSNGFRDVIDATNNNAKQILDFLVQDKLSTLQNENQSLRLAASQAQQNVTLERIMEANTQEILNRTAPIPVPAYPAANLYGTNGNCCNPCNPCCNNSSFF